LRPVARCWPDVSSAPPKPAKSSGRQLLKEPHRAGRDGGGDYIRKTSKPGLGLDLLNRNPRNCNNCSHREQADWNYCPD
jgi:hypothetical protein